MNKTYVIPSEESLTTSVRPYRLLFVVVFGAMVGVPWVLTGSLVKALDLVFPLGLILAVVISLIAIVPAALRSSARIKANRERHNFAWYRETFPDHAHPNGHVSCRHCGSHKMHTTNMMSKQYMRIHACGSCGETLYYSPEKR